MKTYLIAAFMFLVVPALISISTFYLTGGSHTGVVINVLALWVYMVVAGVWSADKL